MTYEIGYTTENDGTLVTIETTPEKLREVASLLEDGVVVELGWAGDVDEEVRLTFVPLDDRKVGPDNEEAR